MNNFILELNSTGNQPLYQQLYSFLVQEIQAGNLKENEKLPSKRELSAYLKISLNTIDTAYQMLVDEGYVRSMPRSGFYVCKYETLSFAGKTIVQKKEKVKNESFSFRYDFSANAVDTEAFPYATWSKITKEVMYQNPQLLSKGHPQGDACLREALGKYLHEFRGIRCTSEQIIIGAGIEYLLGLITEILGEKSVYAVENPGYMKTFHIIKNNSKKINCISMDENGILTDELKRSDSNVAYITPSHQYPMGTVMPIGRRLEILRWANAQAGRYIIEDDYDSEFRFNGRPIPSLQSMDDTGKVIYIGTFSRSIAPSIRIAYMVLPDELLNRYQKDFNFYSSTVSRFEQHTLYRFIHDGHFGRHINRMRNVYRKRKDTLVGAFKESAMGGTFNIIGENAGLHFLLQVNNGRTEQDLIALAATAGVKVTGLSQYCLKPVENLPKSTIVLGYAGFPPEDMKTAAALLCNVWQK